MKKRLQTFLMFVVLLGFSQSVSAQVSEDDMRLAVDVLKGKETEHSQTWAVELLEESLNDKRDAFVLNVLGIAYLHGLGVVPDTTKFIAYSEESGANDYRMAYHNLGMFYKYLEPSKQDYVKAYNYFQKGVEAGSPTCCYNAGFMLYKGLGCNQNYTEAAELFRRAAEKDHAPSLFMLGLCYRNGYGVVRDDDVAKFLLNRASMYGNRYAMEELVKENPENDPHKHYVNIDESMEIPATMPDIEPYVLNNTKALAGKYQGVLATYDWSGQNVISECPLTVDMCEKDGHLYGLWLHGNDSVLFNADVTKDGGLRFDSTEVVLYDRYAVGKKQLFRFDNADISYTDDYISGQLRLYSMDEREPARPMYLCLRRCNLPLNDAKNGDNSKIWTYPNPFQSQVTVKFELEEPCASTKICLYTRTGVNKQSYNLGSLEAGVHTYTFSPNITDGVYVLHVVAGEHIYQTIIIRER